MAKSVLSIRVEVQMNVGKWADASEDEDRAVSFIEAVVNCLVKRW